MWFKNARIYNVDYSEINHFFKDERELQDALESASFRPCMAQEVSTIGFAPLFGPDSAYCFVNGSDVFCRLVEETKLLPSSVIKTELDDQVRKREQELQRPVKKTEKEALKTAVLNQLLSKAFATRRELLVWCNPEHQMVAIGATSAKRAEKALAMLRQAFGSFPATVPQPRCVVEDRMTSWLSPKGQLPSVLQLGTDTVLKSPEDDGGVIRASREDLSSDEIAVHVDAGKVATEIQVVYDDSLSMVLGSDLSLKRLKPLDQYLERNLPAKSEDAAADIQAHLILQGQLLGEVSELLMEIFDCDR
ncbi:MAG: recombination-associated protein RdgC [Succinivibrio sp.]|nr:recombination-associated protein RdgC [Succinivibrio sp.]